MGGWRVPVPPLVSYFFAVQNASAGRCVTV